MEVGIPDKLDEAGRGEDRVRFKDASDEAKVFGCGSVRASFLPTGRETLGSRGRTKYTHPPAYRLP